MNRELQNSLVIVGDDFMIYTTFARVITINKLMTMKEMKQWLMVAAVVALCGMMTGCKGKAQRHVNGTMEEAVALGEAPQAVVDLMKHVNIDDRYEMLMEENLTGVSVKVWSLLKCSDEVSSEGYGIVVGKDLQLDVLKRTLPTGVFDLV